MLCHGFTSCPDYSKRKSTDFSFNVIVAWLLGQNLSLIRQSDEVNHFLQGALSTSRWRFNIEEFELFGVKDFSVICPQCSQTRAGVSPGVWGGVYYFVRLHVGSVLGILIQYLVRCCALLCALRTRRWWCREKKKKLLLIGVCGVCRWRWRAERLRMSVSDLILHQNAMDISRASPI